MDRPAAGRVGGWRAALRSTVPTKPGRLVVWASSLLLVGAFTTGRPALYAGASLLLALYLVGHLGAAYAAASLEVDWDAPSRVFAGEPFPLRVHLRHRGRIAIAGLEVHELAPGAGPPVAVAPRIAAGGALTMEARGKVRRRGLHVVPPPAVAVRWPFLLAVAVRTAGEPRSILAYPRRIPVSPGLLRSRAPEAAAASSCTAPCGGSLFRGVRDWQWGDPPRAIAWRATARHDRMVSREFEREDAARAVVALDADARDLPAADRASAVERACSLAASLLLRLRADGRRASFAAWTPEALVVHGASSRRGLGRALEGMALLESGPRRGPRKDPLALLPPSALRGARVILVRAATGPRTVTRGPHRSEVVTLPALRATFSPGRGS